MSFQCEEPNFDFDFDFFNQASSKPVSPDKPYKVERSRKAILILKKKIVATDTLIRRYYEKKDEIEQLERSLQLSKEECKQTCLDFKNIVEKCSLIEKETNDLRCRNAELEEKCSVAENLVQAIQSHANQLQLLIKEKEATIQSLTTDNKLQRANEKDSEKKDQLFKKEKADLIKDISVLRSVILGKKKLNKHTKTILQKYKHCNVSNDDEDSVFGDSDSDIENCSLSLPAGKVQNLTSQTTAEIDIKRTCATSKDDNEHDSDCSNEHTSADTGRGSSLASSDGEKCFNSPDYYPNHSPNYTNNEKEKTLYINTPTSPVHSSQDDHNTASETSTYETIQIVLSPVNTEEELESSNSQIKLETISCLPNVNKINKQITREGCAISNITESVTKETSTDKSQSLNEVCEENNNINTILSNPVSFEHDSGTGDVRQANNEKEYLELLNNDDFDETNTGDCEIEMILNEMRFNRTLITPIPSTPSKSRNASAICDKVCVVNHREDSVCKEAAKAREENKILFKKYNKLEQELFLIKDLLKFTFKDIQPNPSGVGLNNDVNLQSVEENNTPNLFSLLEVSSETSSQIEDNITSSEMLSSPAEENKASSETSSFSPTEENIVSSKILLNTLVTSSMKNRAQSNESQLDTFLNSSPTLQLENNASFHYDCHENSSEEEIIKPSTPYDIICQKNSTHKPDTILINKKRKLSKLEKLRKRLVPQGKIKGTTPAARKMRFKPKRVLPYREKKITETESSKTLNNKEAYERAVQIMSEFKSKQKLDNIKDRTSCTVTDVGRNISKTKNRQIHDNKAQENKTLKNKEANKSPIRILSELRYQQGSVKTTENSPIEINEANIASNGNEESSNINKAQELDTTIAHSAPKGTDINTESMVKGDKCNQTIVSSQCTKELVVAVVKCDDIPNSLMSKSPSPKRLIATRSCNKYIEELNASKKSENEKITTSSLVEDRLVIPKKIITDDSLRVTRKRQQRESTDNLELPSKRILRSSNTRQSISKEHNVSNLVNDNNDCNQIIKSKDTNVCLGASSDVKALNYSDLDIFDVEISTKPTNVKNKQYNGDSKKVMLCVMLDKYGKTTTKKTKKMPDSAINSMKKTLQNEILNITEMTPDEAKQAMNNLVGTIQSWDFKLFVASLMSYLADQQRKIELFNKISSPPAPPMTKSEQILIYVISQLVVSSPSIDALNCILFNIEYVLFKLNRTPDFDTIETMSHFYAVLCRYYKMKSRLRLFMLDAMYCIQFKAIPLIKQCLDVWMHVLPLAHMGIAKSPLVTCLVYLLHYYKCEDKFNRVQDIRNILSRKYFYEITDWNEPRIIEMFRNAIQEIRAVPIEMKLLRIALIVIAKRYGPRWCQKNIIQNLLLPILEKEGRERVRIFCISMLGPLLKPYPSDMKVHCEILFNMLQDMLKENLSSQMEEAIMTSLICMSKHNQSRVLKILLTWKPQQISSDMETAFRDFVEEKPLYIWKSILTKIQLA